jgi:superfamily II DNA or RNA helicase
MILRPRQEEFVKKSVVALKEHGNTLGIAPTGCHGIGTPILMFDGTIKPVESIKVGELLMGPDSKPRQVLELYNGIDQLFEIRPIKGESFIVNSDHILSLVKTNEGKGNDHQQIVNISVKDYLQKSPNFKHLHKLYRASIDFSNNNSDLPIEPYFLGVLLGDGSFGYNSISITTSDPEIAYLCQLQADKWNLDLRIDQIPGNEANSYFFSRKGDGNQNLISKALKALNLKGKHARDKFIPYQYKTASRQDRAAILAGLIDTDGHQQHNIIEYTTSSKILAQDVAFIARSLGFLAIPKNKIVNSKTYYRFSICGDFSDIPIRVARKIPTQRKQKKNPLRTGFTIHQLEKGEYFGFRLDQDHLYLLGDFTVTHNSGKTIMLSSVISKIINSKKQKALILAHRDELTSQNQSKFLRVNPDISTSIFDAKEKSFDGQAVFAMVQTLCRQNSLSQIPKIDFLVIDEAHHSTSDSYQRIISRAKTLNPNVLIYGVTATPNRSDKKNLSGVFSNVADQIRISELIASGHLVPPKTYIIDVGTQKDLGKVKKTAGDFDMSEVEKIMNKSPITDAVFSKWQQYASSRKTVIFCSTVKHAISVTEAFNNNGVKTSLVHGGLSDNERKIALAEYEKGNAQVIVNVSVLTEGWDYQPTSCVILLRPSSFKSTMIQMIGRGLRVIDPEIHPNITKENCIILDFGTSSLTHGCLEVDANLETRKKSENKKKQNNQKSCFECNALIPSASKECPLCGADLSINDEETKSELTDFEMTEIDLLTKRSNFKWCDLFDDSSSFMASGFNAFAGVFFDGVCWYAIGGSEVFGIKIIAKGSKQICLAKADDFLNEYETYENAYKSKKWLNEPASVKQLNLLPNIYRTDFGITKYKAANLLKFHFNKQAIKSLLLDQPQMSNAL